MRIFIRRFAALLLVLAVMAAGLTAMAAEKTLDVTYVKITGDEFVADTFNGVEARYNLYGRTYYCSEFITRYYAQVYGLTVRTGDGGPKIVGDDGYWFELAETPKPGDILYGSAAMRGKGYSHWALVKSYDAETGIMTLIEQNWRWNGQAGINRQIEFPSSAYNCYTLRSGAGEVSTLHEQQIDSSWASDAIRAAEDAGIFAHYGSFSEAATREQFCEMVVNLVISTTGEQTLVRELPIDDDGMTDESYCAQAYAMGILSGSADGQLHPEGTLTRAQAAVILARAYSLCGAPVQAAPETLAQFADCDAIGAWAADSVAAMAELGVLQGDSEGRFLPSGQLSVAAAVTVAMRAGEALRVQADIDQLMPSTLTYAARATVLSSIAALGG